MDAQIDLFLKDYLPGTYILGFKFCVSEEHI